MKLYIKQKVFSWRARFAVKDEYGADRYYAQGEILSWGRKLHVFDAGEQETAFIRQKVFSFLPRYFIELNGHTYELVKNFTLFRPRFHLEGVPWTMHGDFWAHEYTLESDSGIIMQLSKHWFTWGDSYELDIANPEHELLCLCIALTLDCINADEEAASSSST